MQVQQPMRRPHLGKQTTVVRKHGEEVTEKLHDFVDKGERMTPSPRWWWNSQDWPFHSNSSAHPNAGGVNAWLKRGWGRIFNGKWMSFLSCLVSNVRCNKSDDHFEIEGECYGCIIFFLLKQNHHAFLPIAFSLYCEPKDWIFCSPKDNQDKWKRWKVSVWGDDSYLFIQMHSPCISSISFLLSWKECTIHSKRMVETKGGCNGKSCESYVWKVRSCFKKWEKKIASKHG